MTGGWLRTEQTDLAIERILDGAAAAFVELGVTRTGMADIARHAGCSRGTVYRYFKNRHELDIAYVNRAAISLVARIAVGLARIKDPRRRLIEAIVRALREVRTTPGTAVWFEPGQAGITAGMSRSSAVIGTLASTFVSQLIVSGDDDAASALRAQWLVRIMVSLLTMPGKSEDEERTLIARFVVPVVLDDRRAASRPS